MALLFVAFGGAFLFISLMNQPWYWLDLWLSRDQQGIMYFKQSRFLEAAERFENIQWKAYAFYAAEDFDLAHQFFSKEFDAEAYFNRANTAAHRASYNDAANYYAMAIALRPDFQQAKENLRLVEILGKKVENNIDYASHSDGKMKADDIVFDLKDKRHSSDIVHSDNDQALGVDNHTIWLKGLRTSPAEFLRHKFDYQLQAENNARPEKRPVLERDE